MGLKDGAGTGSDTSADSVMPIETRISLLKVDVEGSELSVLQGIRASHWQLIDQIVLECTLSPQSKDQDYVSNFESIYGLLVAHGFQVIVESVGMTDSDGRKQHPGAAMIYATRE